MGIGFLYLCSHEEETMSKVIEIKLQQQFYDDVKTGRKPFELRKNDRDYQVGDILRIREINAILALNDEVNYTGREIYAEVTYALTGWGLHPDYIALGIKVLWSGLKNNSNEMSSEMAKAIHAFYLTLTKEEIKHEK